MDPEIPADTPSIGPNEIAELRAGRPLREEIFKRYYDYAWEYARHQIEDLSARVGASDVAAAAMKSALSAVQHGRFEYRGAGSFRALLFHILEHKIKDRVRTEHKKTQDARRDRSFEAAKHDRDKGATLSPEEMAEAREGVDAILAMFLQNPNPVKRLVRILAFFGDLEPIRIHRAVAENYETIVQGVPSLAGTQPPALRTVQAEIMAMNLELKREYGFDPE